MRRVSLSVLMIVLLLVAGGGFASAQQGHGNGSIYYSPSGHRGGWAKSLGDDPTADSVAKQWCQGGQVDSLAAQAFNAKEGGVYVTSSTPTALTVPVSDCVKVIKFDSRDNHQCGGFGFNADGRFSNGVRASDQNRVQNDLSSWQQNFIICNDDRAVGGTERFLNSVSSFLGALNTALGGKNTARPAANVAASAQPGPIAFRNDTTLAIPYAIKCSQEPVSAYRTLNIAPGQTQTVDPTVWGIAPCSNFDVSIDSRAADGSRTTFHKVLNAGGPYSIFVNPTVSDIEVATAQSGSGAVSGSSVIISNDGDRSLYFFLSCPGGTPAKMTLDAGKAASYTLPCAGGTLDLPTNAITKHYDVVAGQTYHLHWDSNGKIWTLIH